LRSIRLGGTYAACVQVLFELAKQFSIFFGVARGLARTELQSAAQVRLATWTLSSSASDSSTLRIFATFSVRGGTSGSRQTGSSKPISAIPALTGVGLVSIKFTSISGNSFRSKSAPGAIVSRRRIQNARALLRKLLPLIEVNFIETNPTPVKAGMAEMGLLEPVWRLPLVPPRTENVAKDS